MRIAFCADIHIGNHRRHGGPVVAGLNRRCRYVLAAFAEAVRRAEDARAARLVVLGDLLDYMKIEPQVLAAVQEVLAPARIPVILLGGNHEQNSTAEGDHALGPLAPVARIVTRPEVIDLGLGVELALVPSTPGDPSLPPAAGILPRRAQGQTRIAGIHRGISDGSTPAFLRGLDYREASRWAGSIEADALFTGDWHERRSWSFDDETTPPAFRGFAPVHQCGALVPTGWDNPGFTPYGKILIYDSIERTVETLHIPGPRFVRAKTVGGAVDAARIAAEEGSTLFLQLTVGPARVEAATAFLEEATAKGAIVGGEVEVETGDALTAAREAATAVRQGSTLDESIAGYVEAMPLELSVDRADVLHRSRAFLGLPAQGSSS